jgi:hypothetical protein
LLLARPSRVARRLMTTVAAALAAAGCGAAPSSNTARTRPETGTQSAAAGSVSPSGAHRCTAAVLRLLGSFGAGTGNIYGQIFLFDVAKQSCTLVGYPRLEVLSDPRSRTVTTRPALGFVDGNGIQGRAVLRTVVLSPMTGRVMVPKDVDAPSFLIAFNNYCGSQNDPRFVAEVPGDPTQIPIPATGDRPFASVCVSPHTGFVIGVYPFAASLPG